MAINSTSTLWIVWWPCSWQMIHDQDWQWPGVTQSWSSCWVLWDGFHLFPWSPLLSFSYTRNDQNYWPFKTLFHRNLSRLCSRRVKFSKPISLMPQIIGLGFWWSRSRNRLQSSEVIPLRQAFPQNSVRGHGQQLVQHCVHASADHLLWLLVSARKY